MVASDEIREARTRAEMSQTELSQRSGVAQPNIAAYEAGTRRPSATMLSRLLTAARPRPSAVVAAHRAEILRLAGVNKADDVRMFGSIARGEDTPDSDVDLLVRFAPDASLFDQARLILDLEELLGVSVDVVSEGGLTGRHHQIRTDAVAL